MPKQPERYVDRMSIAAVICAAVGLIVFLVCIGSAISVNRRWSFEHSFLSELGASTQPSASLFTWGVCGIAAGVVPLFLNFLRVSHDRLFGLIGLGSALALAGIGLTPMDTHLPQHNLCLGLWLVALVTMLILQFLNGWRSGHYVLQVSCWVLGSLIFAYLTGMLRGTAPLYQKFVIVGAIAWLALISWLTARGAFVLVKYGIGKVGHDRKTQAYLRRLESEGMYGPEGRASGRKRRS